MQPHSQFTEKITALKKGIYAIRLTTDKETHTAKFIKE
ncbi:MAG: T9SS type A sorting domain-containing protein [Bacteroidia bacterium]